MAIPSPPLTFFCRSCDWKKTRPRPISDCRIPGFDHFSRCPNCGGEEESRRAGVLEVLKAQVGQAVGKRR